MDDEVSRAEIVRPGAAPGSRAAARLVIPAGVAIIIVFCVLVNAFTSQKDDDPASAPSRDAVYGWDAFVASGRVPPTVVPVIESVTWDGITLVAETSLGRSDVDTKPFGHAVCLALTSFAIDQGGFRPVKVVARDGALLFTRAAVDAECEWRRG